ncbi:hypothetical protein FACS189491_06860 [Spirochaetia bacterium]|nr:hypothetical protein FACS189491_06860 [Spirochaetia bacterium]
MVIFLVPYALFSVYISFLDIKTGHVPRLPLWGALALALLFKTVMGAGLMPVTGGLFGLGVFLLAYRVSKKKLGLADVWYAALIGIVFEPLLLCASLGVSCVIAIAFILLSKKKSIPFIPFMAAGSFSVLPFLWVRT